MRVLSIIDRLNANSNVVDLEIAFHNDDSWNDEIVTMMMDRYTNVHNIKLDDYNH